MVFANNKRATFDYEIIDEYIAGIELKGSEVKSIRVGGASIKEAYVKIIDGELWLIGCYINPYKFSTENNSSQNSRRDIKLLMHRIEINRLKMNIKKDGLTVVPLAIFAKKNLLKLKIALGRGKKKYDKRASEKEKEIKEKIRKSLMF